MKQRAAEESNPFAKALLKLYAFVYAADRKYGFPRPVTAPTIHRQRLFAIILLACQTGITFTGALVRVTGSGLGCSTWPQCQPGSLFPVAGSAPWVHQIIEFGNRTLTFVLSIAALVCFISVVRAARRTPILHLAFIQGIGIIVQAVLGGITVHMDLMWWTVALHFLPSMLLVFLAAKLVVRIGEPDDGEMQPLMPRALRLLTDGSSVSLAIVLITGTMVTGAGPHAGDEAILPEHRLQVPLIDMAHVHAGFMYLYLGLTIGLLAGVFALNLEHRIKTAAYWVIGAIILQAAIGIMQYWLGVPRWSVPLHVIGSGLTTAATGFLWALKSRYSGGNASHTGTTTGDSQRHEAVNAKDG
ncbi:COX15/CtaA family protein [Corynebacterium sp. c9Ua_112]|uniref:COX15/CtaA family protein n=1 Tax=Corynebacterium macclintockiae TaxID=2913501 RepID=A0A9X3M5E1_9CORY|nr:COX15/CtaA family protein [Corynebacterium macclintockiae]MCZ9304485.1 COX15/CtaA family protein [Corynebacterium macclintockiae]